MFRIISADKRPNAHKGFMGETITLVTETVIITPVVLTTTVLISKEYQLLGIALLLP